EGVGEGPLWGLPINYETYITAYRADIFQEHGITPPQTYDELLEITRKLAGPMAKDQTYVVTTRFQKYWDLPYLTYGTMVLSYGGRFLDEEGNVAIASPEVVAATEQFINILKAGAPEGVVNTSWYDALQQFASGRYAIAFNE